MARKPKSPKFFAIRSVTVTVPPGGKVSFAYDDATGDLDVRVDHAPVLTVGVSSASPWVDVFKGGKVNCATAPIRLDPTQP
jgi:hypothetical protein